MGDLLHFNENFEENVNHRYVNKMTEQHQPLGLMEFLMGCIS